MIFSFDEWELDTQLFELRRNGQPCKVEPQAFNLLHFLIRNRDRVVTRDEIVDEIWDGRIVTEATISTCLKAARQALGDDGKSQRFIKTARGRGFRFVGDVRQPIPSSAAQPSAAKGSEPDAENHAIEPESTRPSIAIVPFKMVGSSETYAAIADAIPAELIASLSRLRWLMVIARGSTFRFRGDVLDMAEINRSLGAQYCLSGIVEIYGTEMIVGVELSDTRTHSVVWSDRFSGKIDDVYETREQIVADVISALELRIPMNEAENARLKSPESLDAWSLYHLGLHHVFQFNEADTDIATDHFERAIKLDPNFARAHAGLSYTHFQNAFHRFSDDPEEEQKRARKYAEQSMALDPLDPFVNLALGRSEWLEGNFDSSRSWIERSIDLNPNYAYGHYNHSLLNGILCDGEQGASSAAKALTLSPLDPVSSSMLAIRGMNCLITGDEVEAVSSVSRAVQGTGKHAFVYALAAIVFAHAGDRAAARSCIAGIHEVNPTFRQEDFFRRFYFAEPERLRSAKETLRQLGLN